MNFGYAEQGTSLAPFSFITTDVEVRRVPQRPPLSERQVFPAAGWQSASPTLWYGTPSWGCAKVKFTLSAKANTIIYGDCLRWNYKPFMFYYSNSIIINSFENIFLERDSLGCKM
jgi:hypothetical protein